MANVNKIEIARTTEGKNMLTIKKGFLGIGGKIVLNQTGATMRPIVKEYVPAEGDKMLRIVNLDNAAMAQALSASNISTVDLGNIRLEALTTEDGSCLMMQMYKHVNFKWSPITELKVLNGNDAQAVGKLL